ncbi:hypothetical protein AB0I66_02160 [Streptomyces sp. NPDC050439]|uniref:hypothetical protein n=1 Tax=unclassified Streptomyces TaxID=2593676 RepID=UPI003422BD0C
MNHKHGDEHEKDQKPQHAETAAEEVLDEAEDAETRVPGGKRDREKDGEAADALTPNPSAQDDVQREDGRGEHDR